MPFPFLKRKSSTRESSQGWFHSQCCSAICEFLGLIRDGSLLSYSGVHTVIQIVNHFPNAVFTYLVKLVHVCAAFIPHIFALRFLYTFPHLIVRMYAQLRTHICSLCDFRQGGCLISRAPVRAERTWKYHHHKAAGALFFLSFIFCFASRTRARICVAWDAIILMGEWMSTNREKEREWNNN